MSESKKSGGMHFKANLLAGVLTIIPLLVVWLVLRFVFAALFQVGAPVERALVDAISDVAPSAEPILTNPIFEWCVAIVVALLLIYAIGAAASHVVGNRLLAMFENLIARIPGIQMVYSASKKLISVLQQPVGRGAARIILFDFPYPGVKVVGLVMRTFTDPETGEDMAFVYIPTTPNPTSGYLEIVPVNKLVSTNLTMDQAMTLIVSGGAITPDEFSVAPKGNGLKPGIGNPPTPPGPEENPEPSTSAEPAADRKADRKN